MFAVSRRRRIASATTARRPVLLVAAIVASFAAVNLAGGVTARGASTATVKVYFAHGPQQQSCTNVRARKRTVAAPGVLRGAMAALLRGPTRAERRAGYGGWFSSRTAGRLRGVRISAGVARIDFRDLRRIIPNASTSCGSALLLAQLNRTARQFPTVRRAVYSFDGNVRAFYAWLQLSPPPA